VQIKVTSYDHPDAAHLIDEAQQDELARYGDVDQTVVQPTEFAEPHGVFLVGYLDGAPVACGGWRTNGPDAELKRLYVVPAARRRGLASALLAELESSAQAAGRRRMILETGLRQPEALALYRKAGYTRVEPFGYYASDPETVHLGKLLNADAEGE